MFQIYYDDDLKLNLNRLWWWWI